jgi:hypothetical protein
MAQINMRQNQGLGASATVEAITNSLGPFETLSTGSTSTAIKALLAVFKVAKSALEGSIGEFEEGLQAGCGKMWSAADAQEMDNAREAIKTIDTHMAQFEGLLKSLR